MCTASTCLHWALPTEEPSLLQMSTDHGVSVPPSPCELLPPGGTCWPTFQPGHPPPVFIPVIPACPSVCLLGALTEFAPSSWSSSEEYRQTALL